MRQLTVIAILFAGLNNTIAQTPVFEWARGVEISGANLPSSSCESLKVDNQGNVISAGYFKGTSDFDTDPTFGVNTYLSSNAVQAGYIQKLDSNGDFLWAVKVGGATGNSRVYSVDVDALGNVYCTGFFQSTVDFDSGAGVSELTAVGSADAFVLKLNANGTFAWVKQYGDSDGDIGFSIDVDDSGNISIVGVFAGTVDFDAGSGVSNMTSHGYSDMFITKLDASGDFIWAKQIGGPSPSVGFEEEVEHTVDNGGNLLITGWFYETIDFDPSASALELTNTGGSDMFAVKLDSNGSLVWAKQVGGTSSGGIVVGHGIATDASGNVYITGKFTSNTDFDPGPGIEQLPAFSDDVYVLKLDSDGTFVWVREVLGNQDQVGYSIATTADGSSYVTGSFKGTADFDNSLSTFNMTAVGISSPDVFTLKLDTDGSFEWATKVGSVQPDYGSVITVDDNQNVYTLGVYGDPASESYPELDFDPGAGIYELPTSAANPEGFFIQKLSQNGNPVGVSELGETELMSVYPNPTNGMIQIVLHGFLTQKSIRIYDMTGKMIYSERSSNQTIFDYELPVKKGVYLIQVVALDGKTTSMKVVRS